MLGLVGAALTLPWFPAISAGGVDLGGIPPIVGEESGAIIPVAALVTLLVWTLVTLRTGAISRRRSFRLIAQLFVAYAAVCAIAFLIATPGNERAALSAMYLLQSLLPVATCVFAHHIGTAVPAPERRHRFASLQRGFCGMAFASSLIILIATLAWGPDGQFGVVSSIFGIELTKVKRFMPTVVAGAVVLEAVHPAITRRGLRWTGIASGSIFVMSTHSRFASGALMIGALVWLGRRVFHLLRRRTTGRLTLLLLIASAGVAAIPLSQASELRAVSRWATPTIAEDRSSELRVEAAQAGLVEGLSTPLGRGFAAAEQRTTGGAELAQARVANSENGYVELALRAGPAALILMVSAWIGMLSRLARSSDGRATAWVLAIFVVAGGMVQTSFTEPYSSTAFFALAGFASACLTNPRRITVRDAPKSMVLFRSHRRLVANQSPVTMA